jgi:hypothetical protein
MSPRFNSPIQPIAALIAFALLLYWAAQSDDTSDPCPDGYCPPSVERFDALQNYAPVPFDFRQRNWPGPTGQGSCVHASTITILRWQGQHELADMWRRTYHSGETATRLIRKLHAQGVRYAYTDTGDPAFLDWALRNRFGAGITYFPAHAVNLIGLDDKYATLLDNNRPETTIRIERSQFLHDWRHKYSGFAWTVVYGPPPPTPKW